MKDAPHSGRGAGALTLGQALGALARHPVELLVRRWNWKSALFSAIFRSLIFLVANLSAGRAEALGAMLAEFLYRSFTAGFYGALTQVFRRVHPAGTATAAALVLVPVVAHTIEFCIHFLRGTPNLRASITASIGFTVLSTLFNLYVMRRGAMVVGACSQPLSRDLARMPRLIAGFAAAGPLALWRSLRR